MSFATLEVIADGPVGRLTLARPERLNALSYEALRELAAAARWFDDRPEVKVVVVSGAGRAFSAGFDLDDFGAGQSAVSPQAGADLGRLMAEAVTGMAAVTVAAVHGHCVGGGVVLAAACDLRVAAASTRFSIPEVDLGIPLAWGGIPRLVRELGPALTKELVLTCRAFSADEAHALRFVNRVVPDRDVLDAALELAGELARKSSFTLRATKRHVNAVAEEAGATSQSFRDADVLAAALHDDESRAAAVDYLRGRRRP